MLLAATSSAPAVAEEAKTVEPPAADPAVERLVEQLRQVRGKPPGQARVVERALKAGPGAVEAVERELYGEIADYLARFRDQAAAVSKARTAESPPDEVVKLRHAVLALQQQGAELTKEKIAAVGEPALKRLAELLLVDREEVLRRSEPLQAARRSLRPTGLQWQRCAVYLRDNIPRDDYRPKQAPAFDRRLADEEELLSGLTASMDESTRQILAANAKIEAGLEREEARAILAANVTRLLLGLSLLAADPKLCQAARDHSLDMRRLNFVGHVSPVAGKAEFWDRAKLAGTTASGENIAIGPRDGRVANGEWFQSPVHHAILLGPHKRIGVGRTGYYFTELVGK